MRQGKTVPEMAAEVMLQARAKNDLLAPSNQITMNPDARISVQGHGSFDVTDYAHGQIAERVEIPYKYYTRMRQSSPELLADNVNHWLGKQTERRMLRTMTIERPVLRAVLSDRYRRLDNFDLMASVLPFMQNEYGKELRVVSTEITETRLYLKCVAPHTEKDINTFLKPGTHNFINEPIQSGFIVQNSEVGAGAISVFPYTMVVRCSNGAVMTEFGQRKYHTGRRQGGDEDSVESLLSDTTKQLDDAAFFSRVKDIIRACLDETQVNKIYAKVAESRGLKIEGKPEQAVEVLSKNFGFNEDEKSSILRTLIDSGQGLSMYGLFNAVTETAKNDTIPYDRCSDLEAAAGKILTLAPSDWKLIATAA